MRKKQSKKRPLLPDPKYKDQLVTRFVNNMMKSGKKSVAYKIFYDSFFNFSCNICKSSQECFLY